MQDHHNSKVLVIGGAGYVGSHTSKLLYQQGFPVVVLDNLSTGHRAAVRFGVFYEGCYGDVSLVDRILREHSIDTVMHFGAKALVPESVENPLFYYSSNVSDTIALLNVLKTHQIKRFIFSSTCATFGEPRIVPIHESVTQLPVNPYGWSKFFIEQILKDMHAAYGMRSVFLRYFNAGGCDPDGELGEDHRPETHLIPLVVKAALGQSSKLIVYGKDYPTKDGSCIRDYVHVNDLATAHIQAMQLLWDQNASFDFNLGSEQGYSVFQVIETAINVTGNPVPFEIGPRRLGDPAVLIADSSKAKRILGWKPKFSLEDMIHSTLQWMQKHPDGYSK